jgi:DNA-binding SARP family transcriptional activator
VSCRPARWPGRIWPDDPPRNPGNALQTLVSRLRGELRQAGIGDVIESHPAGYRLAVPPEAVDVMAFEALVARGRRALAAGDAGEAARMLRDALLAWRGQPLADAAGCDFANAASAKLTELRSSALADGIEADLALGEGASLVGELRVLLAADPLAERPRALLMRALYAAGRQAEALAMYHEGRELLADQLGVDPSAQLEQVYLGILRDPRDPSPLDPERTEVRAQAPVSAVRAHSRSSPAGPPGPARARWTGWPPRSGTETRSWSWITASTSSRRRPRSLAASSPPVRG